MQKVMASSLIACLMYASVVQAQGSWDAVKVLVPGTFVRVYSAGQVIVGDIASVDDAQITVSTHKQNIPILRQAVQQIDERTSAGNSRKRVLVGAGIGVGAAGVATAAAHVQDGAVRVRQGVLAVIVWGAIGALVGKLASRPAEYLVVYRNPPAIRQP